MLHFFLPCFLFLPFLSCSGSFFCELLQCKACTSPSRGPDIFSERSMSLLAEQRPVPQRALSFRTTYQIAWLPSGTPACRYRCSGSWHSLQWAWIHASGRHSENSGQQLWEFRSIATWQHRDAWKDCSLAAADLVSHCLSCVWTL